MGIIFQIKDDEISLFGDPALTGKPNSSDLDEGKKTPFIRALWDALEEPNRRELERILKEYRGEDLQWVWRQMEYCSVRETIAELLRDYERRCLASIEKVPASLRDGLRELLAYNLDRGR